MPDTDFINPTISRSEFIATNTIPVSLTMPTFSWHSVWPPVISQQKLASTTQRWGKTAQQATNCRVHPCWNEQHIPKKSTEVKGRKSESTGSLRRERNPISHQAYIFIFPTLKTRVPSTLESLTILILAPCSEMSFPLSPLDFILTQRVTYGTEGTSLVSLKFLPATPKEKAACHMYE